ncbi:MAG: hypothetical protein HC913_02825 [Microscillaceae bacterium]|nr:hypothetical protein [Microscillaceae bacterium]
MEGNNKIAGIILMCWGSLQALGSLVSFNVAGLVISIIIGTIGWRFYSKSQKKLPSVPNPSKFELTDELIIRLARRLGGRLSVEDLITQTSLNREQARERLDRLSQKGDCTIDLDQVQESGKIYYIFN